jgi:hypothetical protein
LRVDRATTSTKRAWSVGNIVGDLVAIDLRSLAALRIGLGLSVMVDMAVRSFDLVELYTDAGVWPRELLRAEDGAAVTLSAHYWASVDPRLQAALFVLTAFSGLFLALGWRTWWATLACWYLVSSVQIRQPLAYMGGDSILRLMLFWSLFLPLGARFSVDRSQGRAEPRPDRLVSVATAAMLLQVAFVYWFTGLQKDGPLWQNGQAVYYILHRNHYVTAWGVWLRQFVDLLVPLTFAALALERFGPFLAFVPYYTAAFRTLAIIFFWGFHLGLASTLNIGLFPLFSMVAWLPFVPAELWRRLGSSTRHGVQPPETWKSRTLAAGAFVCLLYVATLLSERSGIIPRVLPAPVLAAGTALRLQQSWSMFAPDPATVITRYEFEKTRADGALVPETVSTSFRSTLYVERVDLMRSDESRAASLERFARLRCGATNAGEAFDWVTLRAYDLSVDSLNPGEQLRILAIQRCARPD